MGNNFIGGDGHVYFDCRLKIGCQNSISRCHIQWLGLHAFHSVLSRKQSAYKACLVKLRQELQQPHYQHLPSQLASVLAPAKSICFQDIQF